MSEYIDVNKAWGESALESWYCDSVGTEPPVWTPKHIEELCKDFYVIPKETATTDVAPLIHAHWDEKKRPNDSTWNYWFVCSHCHHNTPERGYPVAPDFCPGCGAIMDEKVEE